MLLAHVVADFTSQGLVEILPNYTDLLYFTLTSSVICIVILFSGFLSGALPKVKKCSLAKITFY